MTLPQHPGTQDEREELARALCQIDADMPPKFDFESLWNKCDFEYRIEADALLALGYRKAGWWPTHKHVKTQGLYRLLHDALDVTENAGRAWVVYQNEHGEVFTQRATRFYDGRFEALPPPPEPTP